MCGIGGVRRYGNDPITQDELNILLCSLEHRGNHATGVALLTGGRIHVHKAPKPAWAFVSSPDTLAFFREHLTDETTMAILHTRFATIGNPEKNVNNHPIYNGHSAIVHNGGINNHLSLFKDEHVERACETDSDIIRALLDKEGLSDKGLVALNKLSGSAAIAGISEDDPTTLLLARSGSPLAYATTPEKLWWASEMGAIQKAVRPWTKYHGLMARKSRTDVSYFTMPDNTAYLLSERPLIRREFKSCLHYNAPDYSRLQGSNYGTRVRSFQQEARIERARAIVIPPEKLSKKKIAPCPGCKQLNAIAYHEVFKGRKCHACNISLSGLDNQPTLITIKEEK